MYLVPVVYTGRGTTTVLVVIGYLYCTCTDVRDTYRYVLPILYDYRVTLPVLVL